MQKRFWAEIKKEIIYLFFLKSKILKYKLISDCKVEGNPYLIQPVLFSGKGKIKIGSGVILGNAHSPHLYSGYCYIEARKKESIIEIDDGVWTNNNITIISNGAGIKIGKDTMIGMNVEIYDSDFHGINSEDRRSEEGLCQKVVIGNNVWIGANVKILKGVKIGCNSIISNNIVVTKSIPPNTIVAGAHLRKGQLERPEIE